MQVLARFSKRNGIPRIIFQKGIDPTDPDIGELDAALRAMDNFSIQQSMKYLCGSSRNSHQIIVIKVPGWQQGALCLPLISEGSSLHKDAKWQDCQTARTLQHCSLHECSCCVPLSACLLVLLCFCPMTGQNWDLQAGHCICLVLCMV